MLFTIGPVIIAIVTIPKLVSRPCADYLHEQFSFITFASVIIATTDTADLLVTDIAKRVKRRSISHLTGWADEMLADPKRFQAKLDEVEDVFHGIMLCRCVDNYLNYIDNILKRIFVTRPETLSSQKNISVETILAHKTFDSLLEYIASRKVLELSYMSLREQSKQLDNSLGFSLFKDDKLKDICCAVVEARNLEVHNRSRVNQLFLSRVPSCTTPLNEKLDISLYLKDSLVTLMESVLDIDERAETKFGIRRDTPPPKGPLFALSKVD